MSNKNLLEEVDTFISRTKRFNSNRISPVGRVGGSHNLSMQYSILQQVLAQNVSLEFTKTFHMSNILLQHLLVQEKSPNRNLNFLLRTSFY